MNNRNIEDILSLMRKRKRQARQLSPDGVVVSVECAEKYIKMAYEQGRKSGMINNEQNSGL